MPAVAAWLSRPHSAAAAGCLRGRLNQRRLLRVGRLLCYGLLGVWLMLVVGQAASVLWMQPQMVVPDPPTGALAVTLQQAQTTDVEAMVEWDLFGGSVSTAPVDQTTTEAVDSRRDYTLQGVILADDPSAGAAIIAADERQRRYRVGDAVPENGPVTLARVLPDRVLLHDGHKFETLWLYSPRAARTSSPPPEATPGATPGLREQPLADVMQLTLQREDGDLVGFRVQPGLNRDAFERTGLQPNDLVTAIDGSPLTDPDDALSAYDAALTSGGMQVTVQRDGAQVELYVDLY